MLHTEGDFGDYDIKMTNRSNLDDDDIQIEDDNDEQLDNAINTKIDSGGFDIPETDPTNDFTPKGYQVIIDD